MNIETRDVAIVLATLIGPFLAVLVAEERRRWIDSRTRKVHIFRTLMATRSATLAANHIEALNLVEVEFHSSRSREREVVEAWRLYRAHLYDHAYPRETWESRRADLMVDFLHSMAVALGYSYDKATIKQGAYYPVGYGDAEKDNLDIRKMWLQVLRGERQLPMKAEVYTNQPPQPVPPKEKGKDNVA